MERGLVVVGAVCTQAILCNGDNFAAVQRLPSTVELLAGLFYDTLSPFV